MQGRGGEGRGQWGQWRNRVKLSKTEEESQKRNVVGRSWPLKLQGFMNGCSCLHWLWVAPEKVNERGKKEEGRNEPRQEVTITNSCDLFSLFVQSSKLPHTLSPFIDLQRALPRSTRWVTLVGVTYLGLDRALLWSQWASILGWGVVVMRCWSLYFYGAGVQKGKSLGWVRWV